MFLICIIGFTTGDNWIALMMDVCTFLELHNIKGIKSYTSLSLFLSDPVHTQNKIFKNADPCLPLLLSKSYSMFSCVRRAYENIFAQHTQNWKYPKTTKLLHQPLSVFPRGMKSVCASVWSKRSNWGYFPLWGSSSTRDWNHQTHNLI